MSKETVEKHWGVHQHMHLERLNGMMMLSSFNEGREAGSHPMLPSSMLHRYHCILYICGDLCILQMLLEILEFREESKSC